MGWGSHYNRVDIPKLQMMLPEKRDPTDATYAKRTPQIHFVGVLCWVLCKDTRNGKELVF